MTTQTTIADQTSKAAEYAAGLRDLADMIEADPHLANILRFALKEIASPNQTYDDMDFLGAAGAAVGAQVTDTSDSQWRHVSVVFGPVVVRGYGAVKRDPGACPRCGSLDPHCGSSEAAS